MTGNEYQKLAMRTNDRKATDRLLGNMLTCDMKYLLQENLIAEDERHLALVVFSILALDCPVRLESSTT